MPALSFRVPAPGGTAEPKFFLPYNFIYQLLDEAQIAERWGWSHEDIQRLPISLRRELRRWMGIYDRKVAQAQQKNQNGVMPGWDLLDFEEIWKVPFFRVASNEDPEE